MLLPVSLTGVSFVNPDPNKVVQQVVINVLGNGQVQLAVTPAMPEHELMHLLIELVKSSIRPPATAAVGPIEVPGADLQRKLLAG